MGIFFFFSISTRQHLSKSDELPRPAQEEASVCVCDSVCAAPFGHGSLKAAVSQANTRAIDKILQRGTRCHKRCRENNQPGSEVETRKTRWSSRSTKQHGRKINGGYLGRLSAALAKTLNGFMHRSRNSTFLGKDETQKVLWSSKAGGETKRKPCFSVILH